MIVVIRNAAKKAVLMITAVTIQRERVIKEPAFLIIVHYERIRGQVKRSGPKKVESFDYLALDAEIRL